VTRADTHIHTYRQFFVLYLYFLQYILRFSWSCLQRLTDHPVLDPPLFFLGSVFSTSFSILTWHFHGCELTHSLTHSLSHILSWLPFSLDFIDQTVPVKQISTFSSTPFLSTEGIMTSFVRQINCIHPSFSSQRMLPVYFLLTNIDCTGPFLPVSYRISVHTQLKSVYDPFLMTITSHAC